MNIRIRSKQEILGQYLAGVGGRPLKSILAGVKR